MQGIEFTKQRLMIPTRRAHLLMDYAAKHGRQHEMQEALFKAYFAEGRNVNSEAVLQEVASEVGLDPKAVLEHLTDAAAQSKYEEEVKEAQRKGDKIKIRIGEREGGKGEGRREGGGRRECIYFQAT